MTLIDDVRKNWVIIVFIGSLISTWTFFSSRLTQAESEIDQLSQVVAQINQINIDLAIIRTDVGYIKEKIK